MSFFDKLKVGLEKTRKGLTENIERLVGGYAKIDDEFLDDLEAILLAADIGVKTTAQLMQAIKAGIKSKEIAAPEELKPFLARQITDMLCSGTTEAPLRSPGVPYVIMVVGVNGVGKTTTIGKLGSFFAQHGQKVILAAGDTFRAAAIEQLEVWGSRSGLEVVKQAENSDPAAVAFDACQAAKARQADFLIIDTAGRLHTKSNLMEELKKVERVVSREIAAAPQEILLVLDATTGQNAVNQAKLFSQVVRVTGVVLTKLDGTAKGGVVIAIRQELGIPIRWVGVGEGVDDLRPFDPEDFANALFAVK
ncbi:MAG: signal recognition particle-docking protein FtsY [Sporomusaceae bacterium]|nr:signal recognition particle-docking protein FtsY [Sporomusaceae bacterium]